MIKIICLGKIKENYLNELIHDYASRINRYHKLEIIELKDEGLVEEAKAIRLESEKITKYISSKDYLITLEIEGKQYTSVEFATKIDKILIENSNITFVIGGSYGLSSEIKQKANLHLSFSKMTFPHQLFRILLLEQIYRAYKINNNESYHK